MSEFKSQEKQEGGNLLLAFEGTIDEDVTFPVVDGSKYQKIVIDLKSVKSINSVGIREWLNWFRPLAQQTEIVLQRCPKAMVFQFNMVDGFLPARTSVASFFVPFYNEDADKEENVLFTVGQDVAVEGGEVKIKFDPSSIKSSEGGTFEMDVTEAKYFQFLKKML